MAKRANGNGGAGYQQVFKNVDDILHKDAGCTSELDYTEQSSWLLFLKYLDALEFDRAEQAALTGKKYTHILEPRFRWSTWAAAPRCPTGDDRGQPAWHERPRAQPQFHAVQLAAG